MTATGVLRCFSFLLVLTSAAPSRGQEKPAPPPRDLTLPVDTTAARGEQPLPSIDLPEFQITGREQIDLGEFPKESAEPGRGLGPPDLTPQAGAREPGPSPLDNDPRGSASFNRPADALRGRVVAGAASYRTPFFDASFGNNSPTTGFLVRGGYKSSAGFDANTDYRKGYGSVGGDWTAEDGAFLPSGSRIEGELGMRGHTYRLYGTDTPDRERTLSRFSLNGEIRSRVEDLFTYGGSMRVGTFSVTDSLRTRETWAEIAGVAEREWGPVLMKAGSGVRLGFVDLPSRLHNPYTIAMDLTATYRPLPDLDLTGGGALVWYRGSAAEAEVRLKPVLTLTWYPEGYLTVFARYGPGVRGNSLELLHEENPYLAPAPDLVHREQLVSFETGVRWEPLNGVTAGATFRHALARNDLVFDESEPGVWTVFPDGITRRTGLDLDVTARFGGEHLLGFSLTLEGTRNTSTGGAIPYVPTVQGAARYEHRFPFGLEAGASLTVVGERTVTLAADRSVGGFGLLDLFAEYPLVERLTVRGVLNNCANVSHRWWDGYRPVPRSVAVSLGYTW